MIEQKGELKGGLSEAEKQELADKRDQLKSQIEEHRRRLEEDFPELFKEWMEFRASQNMLARTWGTVERAPQDVEDAKRVLNKARKSYALERIPGVVAMNRLFDALTFNQLRYKETTSEDIREAKRQYADRKQLLGEGGEEAVVSAQADVVQAEYNLKRSAIKLDPERQNTLGDILNEMANLEDRLASIEKLLAE